MALTVDQLAWLHSEVGALVVDSDLNVRYDRLESVRDVAIEIIRERRNALLESPLKVTLNGVASIDNSANVSEYDKRLMSLTSLDDDPSDPGDDTTGDSVAEPFTLVRARAR